MSNLSVSKEKGCTSEKADGKPSKIPTGEREFQQYSLKEASQLHLLYKMKGSQQKIIAREYEEWTQLMRREKKMKKQLSMLTAARGSMEQAPLPPVKVSTFTTSG